MMENERACVCVPAIKEIRTLAFLECEDLDLVANAMICSGRWRKDGEVFFVNGGYRLVMVRV